MIRRKINRFTWTTSHNEESKEAQFIETIHDCYLYQHLLEPTWSRSTDNPSLIVLVLTIEVMQVSHIEYHAPRGKSDYCVITFKYHCYVDYSQPKEYVYHKTDFNSMRIILLDLCYLTGEKTSWNKTKASQWMNYRSLLNQKFMKSEISSFQNNWVEFHHGKLRVACQLIKSFVMLCGTKVSYTGDGYHQKMF